MAILKTLIELLKVIILGEFAIGLAYLLLAFIIGAIKDSIKRRK